MPYFTYENQPMKATVPKQGASHNQIIKQPPQKTVLPQSLTVGQLINNLIFKEADYPIYEPVWDR